MGFNEDQFVRGGLVGLIFLGNSDCSMKILLY